MKKAVFITHPELKPVVYEHPWHKQGRVFNNKSLDLPPENGLLTLLTFFDCKKPVKKATVTATALGIFDLTLNNQRVGVSTPDGKVFDELKPGWTDYRYRVFQFTYDITDFVHEGENRLTLYAEDDLRSGKQPYGKQSDKYYSHACSYTRTTGIWQTVWLEFVPEDYIRYAKITPFIHENCVRIEAEVSGGTIVTAEAFYDGRPVGKASARVVYGIAAITLPVDELHQLTDAGLTLSGSFQIQVFQQRF